MFVQEDKCKGCIDKKKINKCILNKILRLNKVLKLINILKKLFMIFDFVM